MRIALVNYTLAPPGRGGAERCVTMLAEHLTARHDVTVFSEAAESLDGIRCVQLPALKPPPPDAPLRRRVVVHARDLWIPSVHMTLRRHLAATSFDVVNTHEVQGLSAAAFTAISSVGLPHVHTSHGPSMLCARMGMDRRGEFCGGQCLACRPQRILRGRAAAARIDALIAPSDSLKRMHVDAGIVPEHKALVIRQGVEPGRQRVRRPDAHRVRLGFIGRLSRPKGVLTLLRAAECFPEGWRVQIAGSGPLEPEVIRAARRNPRLEYVGYVAGHSKQEFFDGLDLLLVPSEWEEPAPLVVAEAAIRGIPAVVSQRGGLPESPHCRLFRCRDANSLRQEVERFVASGQVPIDSRRLLSETEQFSFLRYAREHERVLEQVANGNAVTA